MHNARFINPDEEFSSVAQSSFCEIEKKNNPTTHRLTSCKKELHYARGLGIYRNCSYMRTVSIHTGRIKMSILT